MRTIQTKMEISTFLTLIPIGFVIYHGDKKYPCLGLGGIELVPFNFLQFSRGSYHCPTVLSLVEIFPEVQNCVALSCTGAPRGNQMASTLAYHYNYISIICEKQNKICFRGTIEYHGYCF